MRYLRRVIDDELDALLPDLGAVTLDGPKGVGKTATALIRAETAYRLDEASDLAILGADPSQVTRAKAPVLIDEWPQLPPVWDVVRRAVDANANSGPYLLTGSTTPAKQSPVHSGAGRILSLRMRPMALCERGLTPPSVSLKELLAGTSETLEGTSPLGLEDYVREVEASGFPGIRGLNDRLRRQQLDGYLTRIVEAELPGIGVTLRRPLSLRAWLMAYAAASSTSASYAQIQRGATPGDADPPTKVTTITYRDWLTRLWLLDPVPAWLPGDRPLTELGQAPKHQLADPALAARLLNKTARQLLSGEGPSLQPAQGPLVGQLFESLATLTVRVLAQAAEATTSHLRTRDGAHEVDLIVERYDGRLVAIEVKMGLEPRPEDVRHLHWLHTQLGGRLADRIVLTTGPRAYRRRDGVGVVPLALLGP